VHQRHQESHGDWWLLLVDLFIGRISTIDEWRKIKPKTLRMD